MLLRTVWNGALATRVSPDSAIRKPNWSSRPGSDALSWASGREVSAQPDAGLEKMKTRPAFGLLSTVASVAPTAIVAPSFEIATVRGTPAAVGIVSFAVWVA